MKKFWNWLDANFEEFFLMIFLIAMSVVMMAQVIMRKLGASMTWPEEFCRFCFVVSGFLSMGYCVRRDKMLKVDILLGFFPDAMKVVLEYLSKIVTLVFFVYLTYHGVLATQAMIKNGMVSPAMKLPMWTLYASFVLGGAIGAIRQVQDFYLMIAKKGRYAKKEEVAE